MSDAAERMVNAMDDQVRDLGLADEGGPKPWRVDNLGAADWVMRKVAKIDQERSAIDDLASQQIETIKAWWQTELERLAHQRAHWEWLLAQWHLEKLGEDPKAKTIKLPHGVLSARKQPDGIEIADEKGFVAWAAGTEFARAKYEINRQVVKDAVLKNGEILPGVEIVPGEIKFSVAPN